MWSVYSEEFSVLSMDQWSKGENSHWYRKLINIFSCLVYIASLPLPCPSYPPFGSYGTMSQFIVAIFFSIGLVFFYTQSYMGWFMAAFRPCEWEGSRSWKTRRTGCSRKKYWHNRNSKCKCLTNVIGTSFHEEILSLLESKILVNDPSLSIWYNTYIYIKMFVYLKINFS